MNYKKIISVFMAVLLAGLSGCSSNSGTGTKIGADAKIDTDTKVDADTKIDADADTTGDNDADTSADTDPNHNDNTVINQEKEKPQTEDINAGSTVSSKLNPAEMFTDRDKEVGYQESTAVFITLKDNLSECDSGLVAISENTITIKGAGTFVLSGSLTNGQIIVDAEKTDKLQLVLNGADIRCDTSAALYIRQADKVFITLEQGTKNMLFNQKEFIAIDDNNIDAAVFSKDDLTFNGEGSLTIKSTGHGIVSKDDLVFTGGVYEIEAAEHAVNGKESVRIANGSFQIKSGEDGIHAKDKDDASLGFVYIAGGDFEITSGDDGIHADNSVMITNGTITIQESYEGIEGLNIEISGGIVAVKASDDGVNAAGGNDGSGFRGHGEADFTVSENSYIKISGGTITVNAEGDGIDSNGNLFMSGGTVYVSGPTNSGNGALDYNGEAEISGGIIIAAGAGGMEQNFGSGSTQGSILVNASSAQTGAIILKDSSGKELLNYTPEKSYHSAVISCPEIKQGESYEVILGEESILVEMTDLIYGIGNPMGGHGGGKGMKRPDQYGNRPDRKEKMLTEEGNLV